MTTVTRDDIVRFLRNRAQSNACPFCGSKDWAILEDEGAATLFINQIKGGAIQPGRGVPVYYASCPTCAYVRALSQTTVDEYLAANPTEPSP